MRRMKALKALVAAATLALTAPLLVACSTPAADAGSSASADAASVETTVLTITDGWAKSADADGMTGVFGTLHNSGDTDLILTRVESDVAGVVELHEVTAEGVMQEITGEVIVPAQGSYELAPGANHIMLMMLHEDLLAGDDVSFTVFYTVDGTEHSTEFTVLVKDYTGANEEYGDLDHGSHDHGDHDHGDHDHSHGEDEHGDGHAGH